MFAVMVHVLHQLLWYTHVVTYWSNRPVGLIKRNFYEIYEPSMVLTINELLLAPLTGPASCNDHTTPPIVLGVGNRLHDCIVLIRPAHS